MTALVMEWGGGTGGVGRMALLWQPGINIRTTAKKQTVTALQVIIPVKSSKENNVDL